jgi:hypothetical protein
MFPMHMFNSLLGNSVFEDYLLFIVVSPAFGMWPGTKKLWNTYLLDKQMILLGDRMVGNRNILEELEIWGEPWRKGKI